jgi:hypothetical protein
VVLDKVAVNNRKLVILGRDPQVNNAVFKLEIPYSNRVPGFPSYKSPSHFYSQKWSQYY